MKRNASYKKPATKRRPINYQQIGRWLFAVMFVFTISGAGGLFLWKNRSAGADTSAVSESWLRFVGWVRAHRQRLDKKIQKVKEAAVHKNDEPVHFEFYTALPKINVPKPNHSKSEKM